MKITVGEVRSYMNEREISPETISQLIPISNMTIRRLLRKKDSELIPEKYVLHFHNLLSKPNFSDEVGNESMNILDLESVTEHMVKLSQETESTAKVNEQLEDKIKSQKFDQTFLESIRELKNFAFQKENITMSLVAMGALLYFINPLDIIPDHFFPLGYVDDFGVITMSLTKLRSLKP